MIRWPVKRLGDLVNVLSGFAFESERFSEAGDLPIVRIRDVVLGHSSTFYRGEYDIKFLVQNGDILIGMDGEFNRARWNGGSALLNQRVCRITSSNGELDDAYLFYFLPEALKAIERVTPFVTVKHLSVEQLRDIRIPLPPLVEQRRIAEVLHRAENLRAKRRAALAETAALTEAVFLEMFGDPITNTKGFPTTSLRSICTRITDGTHQPPKWSDSGVPFLFVSNIVSGEISLDTEKFISDETHAELTKRCPIEPGDVLYSTVGSYGVPAVVRTNRRFAFQRHIAHLKPNRAILDSEFLRAMLASTPIMRQADRVARGVAQKTVNLADIKDFLVFCPPVATQRDFAGRAAAIEELTAMQRASLTNLDALFASLEHRAFRGEL